MNPRLILSGILAALMSALLSGCKPGGSEEESQAPTEVAVQVGKVTRVTL